MNIHVIDVYDTYRNTNKTESLYFTDVESLQLLIEFYVYNKNDYKNVALF